MQSINICDISSIKECIKTVKCIFGNKSQSQKKERSIDTKLKCLMSGPECDRKSMQRCHNPASVCRAFKNGQEVNAEIIHSQSFLLIHLFKCSVMQIFDQTITCYEYNTFRPVYWTACVCIILHYHVAELFVCFALIKWTFTLLMSHMFMTNQAISPSTLIFGSYYLKRRCFWLPRHTRRWALDARNLSAWQNNHWITSSH